MRTLDGFLSVLPYFDSEEGLDVLAHAATNAACSERWSESQLRTYHQAVAERLAAIESKRAARGESEAFPTDSSSAPEAARATRRNRCS